MNGASIAECLMTPSAACLTSPRILWPLAIVILLIAVGFFAYRTNVNSFRRLRRRVAWALGILAALTGLAASYFFIFDRAAIDGTSSSSASLSAWMTIVSAHGMLVALAAGLLAFALGGRIAKWTRPKRRQQKSAAGPVIAIDGQAASGKGTLAKRLAAHYCMPCLDTGLLYRAVARDVLAAGEELADRDAAVRAAVSLRFETLHDPTLRDPGTGEAASIVAGIPEVRQALLDYQRKFARQVGGAILDGRDIGTIVCPDAEVKIFITATVEERARRRQREHAQRGVETPFEVVLEDIRRRDARDSGRAVAPMEPAPEAVALDTTEMDPLAVFEAARTIIRSRLPHLD